MALTMVQIICIFVGISLVLSIRQELKLAEARLGADILVYPTQAMSKISKSELLMQGTPVQVYKSQTMLSRLADCDGISAVSYQIYISDVNETDRPIRITAYDPSTDFSISPWLSEGQDFIPPINSIIAGSSVVLSDDKTIKIFEKSWPVSGHLLQTGSDLDEMVFVSMDTLRSMINAASEAGIQAFAKIDPENTWSAALIRVDDKQNVESVTNWINIYVRKVTAVRSEESLTSTASDIQNQVRQISSIAIAAWLILLFALWIIQSMLMRERRKELYVWYVIGASRTKVEQVILLEAFWTHLIGALCGIFMAGILFIFFGKGLISGMAIPRTVLLPTAVLSVLLSLFVGCLSAWLAGKRTVRSLSGQILVGI